MKNYINNLKFKDKLAVNCLLKKTGYKIQNNQLNYRKFFITDDNERILSQIPYIPKDDIVRKIILNYFNNNIELFKNLILKFETNPKNATSFWQDLSNSLDGENFKLYQEIIINTLDKYPETTNIILKFSNTLDETVHKKIISNLIKQTGEKTLNTNNIDKILESFPNQTRKIEILLLMKKITKKQKTSPKIKQQTINYISNKIIENYKNKLNICYPELTNEQKEIITQAFTSCVKMHNRGTITTQQLYEAEKSYKNALSISKIKTTDLSHLTIEQIVNINTKKIKKIEKEFNKIYPNQNINCSELINMYIIFGINPTLDLITGKYEKIKINTLKNIITDFKQETEYFIDPNKENYSKIHKYKILNGNVYYTNEQKKLITFLFTSSPNDYPSNIEKILTEKQTSNNLSLANLIDKWEEIDKILGENISLPEIIKLLNKNTKPLLPNEKEIETTLKLASNKYYKSVTNTYKEMQTRTASTIPKIKGIIKNLEYEILDLNDPQQMNVGYMKKSNFKFGDKAENSLIHACTNKNGRIFVIKKDGKIITYSWLWRNGNVVCFDSIETIEITNDIYGDILKTYQEVSSTIMNISKNNEQNPIQLITIGSHKLPIKSNLKKLDKKKLLLPNNEDNTLYTKAHEQTILATSPNYTTTNEFNEKPIYLDKRPKTKIIVPHQENINSVKEAEKQINKITYNTLSKKEQKKFNQYSANDFKIIFYNTDWFIGINKEGEIIQKINSCDPRHIKEMKTIFMVIASEIKNENKNLLTNNKENPKILNYKK